MQTVHLDDPFYTFLMDYERSLTAHEVTPVIIDAFCQSVYAYYHKQGRVFAWRQTIDPYAIVVSEIMLQQTQTQRVAEKYEQFLNKFPTFAALAQAPVSEVLISWVGLGYNRRALALHGIACTVMREHSGYLPDDPAILQTYKGLGPATAASIIAFAFNKPTIFIETNIRAVYLHAFFQDQELVHDKQLLPLVLHTVDQINPRHWYYALMDCGVVLKKLYKNPSRKSSHYAKQSKFEGSDRQIRGAIIRLLAAKKAVTELELKQLAMDQDRVANIIQELCVEGFILFHDHFYRLRS